MGPRDRDDLIHLVDRISVIEASEQADRRKATICRELKLKLFRAMRSGWLPDQMLASPQQRIVA